MASAQGICKNCGSLIMLNDKEELCECLFCDCVFPSAEALEIAKNPGAYTFPNETQPKREGVKKYNVTPVYPDPIPAAVKRAEIEKPAAKAEKNPYEVSPDDVKAPKKIVALVSGITAGVILLVLAISWPLYADRMSHRDQLSAAIPGVCTEFKVDSTKTDGYYVGFSLKGQSNNSLSLTTEDTVTKEDVLKTVENYANERAKEYGIGDSNRYDNVSLTVYASNGGFSISLSGADDLKADNVKSLT